MSITLTQLNSFVAVMRTGSVTAAADALVVTQPSVSAAIAGLSRELGEPLLERDGRSVQPTQAGAAFAPYAADVIGLLDQGARAAREAGRRGGRTLRIAAVTTAAESFVPGLMQAFSAASDELELRLEVGNRDAVVDLVLDHRADVAFTGRPPRSDRVEAVSLWPNHLVVITAPTDPLAGSTNVPVGELARRPWLLREPGSGTRAVTEGFLAASGLEPPTLTVGSNGAVKQAVRAGLGVSIVSRDTVLGELEVGVLALIGVESPPPPRFWHLVRSSAVPARPVVRAFMDFVERQRHS